MTERCTTTGETAQPQQAVPDADDERWLPETRTLLANASRLGTGAARTFALEHDVSGCTRQARESLAVEVALAYLIGHGLLFPAAPARWSVFHGTRAPEVLHPHLRSLLAELEANSRVIRDMIDGTARPFGQPW